MRRCLRPESRQRPIRASRSHGDPACLRVRDRGPVRDIGLGAVRGRGPVRDRGAV